MKTRGKINICVFLLAVLGFACESNSAENKTPESKPNQTIQKTSEVRDDFKQFYDEFQVKGSFVLYDPQKEHYIFYNKGQFKVPYSPASTFKICNSLIGLETGVIENENFVIPWDSVVRNPIWDKDHDLKLAYKNSTVWYYQELARRVGPQQMKYWIDSADYGNKDTSGGIDQFWLTGGLRITPEQQITFLKQLHNNELPFSKRSMDIVKDIMIAKDTLDYVIRAKTGWGGHGNVNIGWYVGYLETKGNVYYFVNCVQIDSKKLEEIDTAIKFDQSRTQIVYEILNHLNLIKL